MSRMSRRKRTPAGEIGSVISPEVDVNPGVATLFPYDRPVPVMTVLEGMRWLADRIGDGAKCPLCRQYCRLYARKLNKTMARGLLWLCSKSGPNLDWVDTSKHAPRWLLSKGGTLATLAHWELIVPKENENEKTRTSGVWRPTERGWKYAHGKLLAPSHVFLYDNRVIGFSNTFIGIEAALGKDFDYSELMKPIRSMENVIPTKQASLFPADGGHR